MMAVELRAFGRSLVREVGCKPSHKGLVEAPSALRRRSSRTCMFADTSPSPLSALTLKTGEISTNVDNLAYRQSRVMLIITVCPLSRLRGSMEAPRASSSVDSHAELACVRCRGAEIETEVVHTRETPQSSGVTCQQAVWGGVVCTLEDSDSGGGHGCNCEYLCPSSVAELTPGPIRHPSNPPFPLKWTTFMQPPQPVWP